MQIAFSIYGLRKSVWVLLIQLFLFMLSLACSAQSGELIIKRSDIGHSSPILENFTTRRWLAKDLGIEMYSFATESALVAAEKHCRRNRVVLAQQRDGLVGKRALPNDPEFPNQSENLERTGFTTAWDLTTGGTTPNNNRIVVAVIDDGFDVEHEDLRENLWRNPGERPGDGIDNDGNGYADDLNGWNMKDDSPRHSAFTHGTQVAGTLGAKGNNGLGITGTNWEVELMLLSYFKISELIMAYEYVRQQRMLWNNTEGREGAFVVATNASFGVEGGTCSAYPVWGGMYDELGAVGILTAAGAANFSWDVDDNGDMPTDCPSDYLIGVANLGTNDLLFSNSAFGRKNIDLAAPGEGSYSLLTGSRYGPFGSTSAAAPYVTGAIALLYSVPCAGFQSRVITDPAGAALEIRDVLLAGVKSLPALKFKVATGGLLDVAESQRLLSERCSQTPEALTIRHIQPNPANSKARLVTNTLVFGSDSRISVYNSLGQLVRDMKATKIGVAPVVIEIDVSMLSAGYYQVRVEERGQVAVAALIVQ